MAKRYFKNLDGLRFFAALTVAFSHLETLKQYRYIPFVQNRFFENAAQIAVTFFFVLSGFLIMWWFLEETDGNTQKIKVKKFYINRISRTWPLYFLVVIISIGISIFNGTFQHDAQAAKRYVAYLLFLPNTAGLIFHSDIYLTPTWSLAVEECFYFFFPLLLLQTQKHRIISILSILLVVFLLLSVFFNQTFQNTFFHSSFQNGKTDILNLFFERYRFYSFLSGTIAASLLFFKLRKDKKKGNMNLYKVLGVLLVFLYFFGITFSFLTQQVYSILFAVFLFVLTSHNEAIYILQNKFMIWGGKRSYAIYLLHVFFILRLINQGSFLLNVGSNMMSILISWGIYLVLILTAAHLSYKHFENPIRMALRKRLAVKAMRSEN